MKNVENDLIPILRKDEESRADDMLLYYRYISSKGCEVKLSLFDKQYRIVNDLVSYERVSRARRKLQEHYADLRPSAEFIAKRKKAEKEFRAYAKGVH